MMLRNLALVAVLLGGSLAWLFSPSNAAAPVGQSLYEWGELFTKEWVRNHPQLVAGAHYFAEEQPKHEVPLANPAKPAVLSPPTAPRRLAPARRGSGQRSRVATPSVASSAELTEAAHNTPHGAVTPVRVLTVQHAPEQSRVLEVEYVSSLTELWVAGENGWYRVVVRQRQTRVRSGRFVLKGLPSA